MNFPNYDLHCHTTVSDGELSPEKLYELALEQEIEVLAVTDHDTVDGYRHLIGLQQQGLLGTQIKLISGAEFTCLLDNQILHIVALNIDINHPVLLEHIEQLKELRLDRAERIAKKLMKRKLPDLLPLVISKSGQGQIGRPHFAKVLCDLKIVATEAEAFKKYLGAGKVANVKVAWPELETVLNIISLCGGVSVLAHPTKYNLTMSKLRRIIAAFKILGGTGIEISYPGINREQQNILQYEVEKNKLLVSAGSDFHTLKNKWTVLGRYPALPTGLPHVLSECLKLGV